jgi:uncharacterized membrane protein YfcA
MPHLELWRWLLGIFSAFMIGVAKTGAPGVGTMIAPLMVLTVGDARLAPAWTLPVLSTADVFAVVYWRRHTETRQLLSLIPWVLVGIACAAVALRLNEQIIRRIIGVIIVGMLLLHLWRRFRPAGQVEGKPPLYGICAGFASTLATASGPVMNLYLLTKKLPKEKFVATGAWFFFAVNILKSPVYAYYHLYSRASLLFDLLMVPPVVAGALAGRWLIRHMAQQMFEVLVIALTAISCLFLFL